MVGYGNHTPVLKKSMERELTEKIHSIAYRPQKRNALYLPETTDIIRKVELEAAGNASLQKSLWGIQLC